VVSGELNGTKDELRKIVGEGKTSELKVYNECKPTPALSKTNEYQWVSKLMNKSSSVKMCLCFKGEVSGYYWFCAFKCPFVGPAAVEVLSRERTTNCTCKKALSILNKAQATNSWRSTCEIKEDTFYYTLADFRWRSPESRIPSMIYYIIHNMPWYVLYMFL